MAADRERLVAGLVVEQEHVLLELKNTGGPGTNPPLTTNITMTTKEERSFWSPTNKMYRVRGGWSDESCQKGGLGIYNFRDRKWQELLAEGGLLHPPTNVQLDGQDIWAAGPEYVAVEMPSPPF